jgi:competence ComEA-like helix-hairpin-helix protein
MKKRALFRGPVGFTPAESKIAVGLAALVLIASIVVIYQRLVRPAPQVFLETHMVSTDENVLTSDPVKPQSSVADRTPPLPPSADRKLLDINTADYADLVRLPGIGPVLAGRIMEYRDRHGPFVAIDSLINVSGIGAVKLGKIRPLICIH